MLKKTITYKDFNDHSVTEDHFFHLSKADLIELEMSYRGGLSAMLQKIVDEDDAKAIISEFKKLLLMSYGKKSPDGKRFIKNQELRDEFLSSEAYSTLFLELVTNADAAAEFVRGVVPAGLADDIPRIRTEPTVETTTEGVTRTQRVLTKAEVRAMDSEELKHLLATGEAVIGS